MAACLCDVAKRQKCPPIGARHNISKCHCQNFQRQSKNKWSKIPKRQKGPGCHINDLQQELYPQVRNPIATRAGFEPSPIRCRNVNKPDHEGVQSSAVTTPRCFSRPVPKPGRIPPKHPAFVAEPERRSPDRLPAEPRSADIAA